MAVPASIRSLPTTVAVALVVVAALCADLLLAVYAESQAAAALGWPLIALSVAAVTVAALDLLRRAI